MMLAEIVEATAADVDHVQRFLRHDDVEEISALGRTTHDAVGRSVSMSIETRAGRINGTPVCVFGVGRPQMMSPIGNPWMLGTEQLRCVSPKFLRRSRYIVQGWRDTHALLENWVDARNLVSVAWLRWLGFKIDDAVPHGPHGVPFHHFWVR